MGWLTNTASPHLCRSLAPLCLTSVAYQFPMCTAPATNIRKVVNGGEGEVVPERRAVPSRGGCKEAEERPIGMVPYPMRMACRFSLSLQAHRPVVYLCQCGILRSGPGRPGRIRPGVAGLASSPLLAFTRNELRSGMSYRLSSYRHFCLRANLVNWHLCFRNKMPREISRFSRDALNRSNQRTITLTTL